MENPPTIEVNESLNRVEAVTKEGTYYVKYTLDERKMDITGTDSPKPFRERLWSAAFQYAEERGLAIIISCPLARAYAERKPVLAKVALEPREPRQPISEASFFRDKFDQHQSETMPYQESKVELLLVLVAVILYFLFWGVV